MMGWNASDHLYRFSLTPDASSYASDDASMGVTDASTSVSDASQTPAGFNLDASPAPTSDASLLDEFISVNSTSFYTQVRKHLLYLLNITSAANVRPLYRVNLMRR